MRLKGTGRSRALGFGLGKDKIAIVGGAVGLVLVIAVIANSWDYESLQDRSGTSPPPVASGTGDGAAPATANQPQPAIESDDDSNPLPPEVEAAPAEPADAESSPVAFHFTDDNFHTLASDPDGYANSTVTITGRVYQIVDQSAGGYTLITFRIHNQAVDSEDSRAAVMYQEVRTSKAVPLEIAVEDCIKVSGVVRGGVGDKNSLGQEIRIPIIDSNAIGEIECVDSAMPAFVTVDSNLTQSYGGITLVADRLQLADDHIRIKIIAKNVEVTDSVFIREKESHVEYLGNVYQSITHLPAFGAYRLDSTVPPESEVAGYLFFERVPDYAGDTFTFRIVIEKVGISDSVKSTFILRI